MKKIILQKDIIDLNNIFDNLGSDFDGAIVTFVGRARKKSNNREVKYLEYEIYRDMAMVELEKITEYVFSRWDISNCAIIHRYGRVEIGETTIFIGVSSPHRREAFQSVRYIINTIKMKVPIWKKEFYLDDSKWVSH